ncbi:50S ribosome-binding GTPase [Actinoplanes sp. LDG1-06]|uniref:50S ribosome-binding GTPase n=1 Tax=Paractinoplanes ovalisporus TaxID=2810368 RepID=A0ABS2AA27_9ACTN|nr:dynamin family protein [Actinoplanes ovalisporus]MBM2616610.1 50S ribosome-binding GTPase [Actinoplanes ovalisporus]
MNLLAQTRDLLDRAVAATGDPRLVRARRRLDEPLRVAIAGKLKAGKSTLLNALIGEELAATDAGECTRVVTWYADGPAYAVTSYLRDGTAEARPFTRRDGAVRIDLGRPAADVDRLEVRVPSARLRRHTLIDTPGIESLSADVSARTHTFLNRDGRADAVIYLLRHLHGGDVRFLEAFHGGGEGGTSVNAIGVLSRADEIGGCRLDAMTAADRVADRYTADLRLRRLCPVVVPVAGLLGAAGATLREEEFRTLAQVAALPMDHIVELLLTADRFAAGSEQRRHVLTRVGLFGVRLSTRLIHEGVVTDSAGLAAALTEHSGITRLRDLLRTHLEGRAGVLKARSALAALDACLAPGSPLVADAERIRAGAHEFVELRLLHQLRSGRLTLADDRRAEMDRLLGGSGGGVSERLGLTGADDAGAAAREAQARWQRLAEHPLSNRDLRTAARAVARTCEGIVAGQNQQG